MAIDFAPSGPPQVFTGESNTSMPPESQGSLFEPGSSTPDADYESGVLMWVKERLQEGEAILKDDPSYEDMDRAIEYIMGDQINKEKPSELSHCPDNRLKNILNQSVAALTDIHPLFGFKTYNPQFKNQEDVLVKLAQVWWVNNYCDLKLGDVIKFAAGCGTGYCEIGWDSSLWGGTGDISLRPLDPRDVIPIKPMLNGGLQDWEGVLIRTAKDPDELRTRFPAKAARIRADNSPSIVARTWTRAKRLMSSVITPSAVDVANASNARNAPKRVSTTELYTLYIKDRRLHLGPNPLIMGDPETTWSYTVFPTGYDKVPDGMDSMGQPKFRKATIQDSKIYPRGRMIIATKETILYDGPNPYWHGMFPIAKLSLDPWPWSLLGIGLVHDLIPIQDAFNEMLGGILDHVRKLLRPAVVADKKVTANSTWERLDTRLPGGKYKVPMGMGGKALEFVSPEPLPPYTFEMLQFLASEMDYHGGVANISQLMDLQQTPGENTIEKMQEALSPVLRLKGRLLEYFLRDIGEMIKSNFFQFYNMPRRVQMLGESGIVFSDFDFDPGTMVPSLSPNDAGYTYHLDKSLPRATRAQWYHKNFTFTITPNSLLAISQISRKLLYLQLRSLQLVDRWTLYDVLEVPNGGNPPGDAQTITDRLMAEMMMFAPPQPPEGRPPTYQESPTMQQKTEDDGVTPRQTVSSSGSGGEPPQQ